MVLELLSCPPPSEGPEILVRVNRLETPWAEQDIQEFVKIGAHVSAPQSPDPKL